MIRIVRRVVVLLVALTPVAAAAAGDGQASMGDAVQACSSHVGDAEGFDNRRSYAFGGDYVTYVNKRDAALKENPNAGNLDAKVLGKSIKELFPKCQAMAASFESAWGVKPDIDKISNALRSVERAVRVCEDIKSRGNLSSGQIEAKVADLEKAKKQATEQYSGLMKVKSTDPAHGGKTYGEMLESCVNDTKGKQSDQAANEARAQKEMQEASARQAAELAKKQAEERAALKARYAKIRVKLRGDRVKVFDKRGEPDDFDGALESAPVWSYSGGTYHDATLVPCTWTYRFKGSKLVSQSKTGPGC